MSGASFIVSEQDSGSRLDFFAAQKLACGARGAKRLAAGGFLLVDGKPRPPHYKLLPGMRVAVLPEPIPAQSDGALNERVRLVGATEAYAAFYKPAELHTARIAGNRAANLEEIIETRWAAMRPENAPLSPPFLLSRLDGPTSGLVVAAFSREAAENFRRMEAAGEVEKRYLAVVHGELVEPFVVRNALDTANRKKTRVLETASPDPSRHTRAVPRDAHFSIPGTDMSGTLIEAHIKRGARHQIRAHLAYAGRPIVGDALYGSPDEAPPLYLHHEHLVFPGFSASYPPDWMSLS